MQITESFKWKYSQLYIGRKANILILTLLNSGIHTGHRGYLPLLKSTESPDLRNILRPRSSCYSSSPCQPLTRDFSDSYNIWTLFFCWTFEPLKLCVVLKATVCALILYWKIHFPYIGSYSHEYFSNDFTGVFSFAQASLYTWFSNSHCSQ